MNQTISQGSLGWIRRAVVFIFILLIRIIAGCLRVAGMMLIAINEELLKLTKK